MAVVWKVDRSKLWPPFADDVDTLLANDPASWFVTYGFRTSTEQAALREKFLAGGPRAAAPGHSAHERGLAVDVTLVKDGKDEWGYDHDPDWQRLIGKIRAHPRLHSLYDIGDGDHIEAVNWRQIDTSGPRAA